MATDIANNQNPVIGEELMSGGGIGSVVEKKIEQIVSSVEGGVGDVQKTGVTITTTTTTITSSTNAVGTAAAANAVAVTEEAATAAAAVADGKGGENHSESGKTDAAAVVAAVAPPPPKFTVHKTNFEKDVIYLYQFSRTPLLPSLSSYCLKVETYLRLAGLKYENVDHKMKFRSKKGQLPFVELNGEEIADSAIIMKELSQKFDKDIDEHLNQEQRNITHAMTSMIENHLVWVVFWWRSKYPDLVLKGYNVNLQHALGSRIPNGILNFCFKFTFGRKWFQATKKVKAQGIGVHKPEEIEEFGKHDLKVLSDMLADKPFFFGDEPTTLDVVSFSLLSQLYFISKDVSLPMRDYMIESCPNLVGHVSRMKERCFPDWEEICTKLDLNAHLPKPEPEPKEGKEGETEKTAEQENNEPEQIEKELEKDKSDEKTEKTEENKEKEDK